MRKKALQYYKQGCNCSQCILKAAEGKYRIRLPEQCMDMCSVINTGFGIGELCSPLIAGVMVFGLLFDDVTAKEMRLKLFDEFFVLHDSLHCAALKKERKAGSRCEELVCEIAGLVEDIIDEYQA